MNKPFTLAGLLLAFLPCSGVFAQSPFSMDHMVMLRDGASFQQPIIQPALPLKGYAKTTGTGSRVTDVFYGTGDSTGTYRAVDSSHYTYSNGRGGNTFSAQGFDTAFTWKWDRVTATYQPAFLGTTTYDPHNKRLTYLQRIPSGNNWINDYKWDYLRDANGVDTGMTSYTWNTPGAAWVPFQQVYISYDGAGRIQQYVIRNWNTSTGTWISSQRELYTYDVNGRPIDRIIEVWQQGYQFWEGLQRYRNYYNSAGHRIAWTVHTISSNGLIPGDSVSCSALTVSGQPLVMEDFMWIHSGWQKIERHILSYNAADQPTIWLSENWNGSSHIPYGRLLYEYNNLGQRTLYRYERRVSNQWMIGVNDMIYRYYYEPFTTGIANKSLIADAALRLHPVPAQQQLTISLDRPAATAFGVAVYDLSGRLWLQWEEQPAARFRKTISTATLPTGHYLLELRSPGLTAQQRFTVLH